MEHFRIPSISTGNMLREAIANKTPLGMQVKQLMDEGKLVPDDLILDLVSNRVSQPDCANGFILDGVPRTLVQAQALDQKGVTIDKVVSIEIDDTVIESRMTGRRVCTKCGASYHIVSNPPKLDGICDHCGEKVQVRKDDAPETVRARLATYHQTTEVLKDYYAAQNKLALVNGDQSIEDAYHDILRALGE